MVKRDTTYLKTHRLLRWIVLWVVFQFNTCSWPGEGLLVTKMCHYFQLVK